MQIAMIGKSGTRSGPPAAPASGTLLVVPLPLTTLLNKAQLGR